MKPGATEPQVLPKYRVRLPQLSSGMKDVVIPIYFSPGRQAPGIRHGVALCCVARSDRHLVGTADVFGQGRGHRGTPGIRTDAGPKLQPACRRSRAIAERT